MKESQGLKGQHRSNSVLDALESRFTGKPLEDPRRENYPRRLQSIYFPPKGKQ
jgi:hypothetical protein